MNQKDSCQWRPKLTPLPCPFCGKKPKTWPLLKDVKARIAGSAGGGVYCANSKCAVKPCVDDGQDVADYRGTGAYIDCAISRWNRRMP